MRGGFEADYFKEAAIKVCRLIQIFFAEFIEKQKQI